MRILLILIMLGTVKGKDLEEKNIVSIDEGIFSRRIGTVGVVKHYDRVNVVLRIPEFVVANKAH